MPQSREQARAILILFYGIDEPTEEQITDMLVFGRVFE